MCLSVGFPKLSHVRLADLNQTKQLAQPWENPPNLGLMEAAHWCTGHPSLRLRVPWQQRPPGGHSFDRQAGNSCLACLGLSNRPGHRFRVGQLRASGTVEVLPNSHGRVPSLLRRGARRARRHGLAETKGEPNETFGGFDRGAFHLEVTLRQATGS